MKWRVTCGESLFLCSYLFHLLFLSVQLLCSSIKQLAFDVGLKGSYTLLVQQCQCMVTGFGLHSL